MVPEARVADIVRGAPSLAAAARTLIDAANAAGGRDNITVVLFRLADVREGADVVAPQEPAGDGAAAADEQPTMVGMPAVAAAGLDTAEPPVPAARQPRGPAPKAAAAPPAAAPARDLDRRSCS